MPRPLRIIVPELCYHFVNRANKQAQIFHDPSDYDGFLSLVREAQVRETVPIVALCLMPNHIHLVVRPRSGAELARWAQWLFTSHARRYHVRYGTNGHVWQGRFKTFAIQHDRHLLIVLRYVERNALTGNLVTRAQDWRWSSLRWRGLEQPPIELAPAPVQLPRNWIEFVNEPQTADELSALRTSSQRQRPFGDPEWVVESAQAMQIRNSLQPLGRPRRNGV